MIWLGLVSSQHEPKRKWLRVARVGSLVADMDGLRHKSAGKGVKLTDATDDTTQLKELERKGQGQSDADKIVGLCHPLCRFSPPSYRIITNPVTS